MEVYLRGLFDACCGRLSEVVSQRNILFFLFHSLYHKFWIDSSCPRDDDSLMLSFIVGVVCLGWYIALPLFCAIGYVQLYAFSPTH